MSKTNKNKARTWGLIVYPDSAPEKWEDLIAQTYLQFAVSPLHDKDINPDGEIKKAHYHVILYWNGPVTKDAALKVAESVNAPMPIKIESVRGAYRYFTHKDNPEKFQYSERDIRAFNGFDISSYIALTKEEKYEAILRIKDIIQGSKITEYINLLDVLVEEDYELFKVACDNTILTNAMVRSMRHSNNK